MWRRSWLSREVLLFSRLRRRGCAPTPAMLWLGLPGGAVRRRADRAARPRRRHGQRLHLPRAVAAGLEHAAHARAVPLDGAVLGPLFAAAIGAGRRAAGWPWPPSPAAAAQLLARRCSFLRLIALGQYRAARHRRGCSRRRLRTPFRPPRRAAGRSAHRRCRCARPQPMPLVAALSSLAARRRDGSAAICSSSASCPSTWRRRTWPRKRGGMNLKRLLGLDNLADRVRLRARIRSRATPRRRRFPIAGSRRPAATARSAAACSSASRTAAPSASAATRDHPVNRGMLCPKGLSEHHTLDADEPRAVPAAAQATASCAPRRLGRRARRRWSTTFRDVQAQSRAGVASA